MLQHHIFEFPEMDKPNSDSGGRSFTYFFVLFFCLFSSHRGEEGGEDRIMQPHH